MSYFGWWARFEDDRGDFSWLDRCYRGGSWRMTEDPDSAYRFGTREEAAAAVAVFGPMPRGKWEVVEHKDEGVRHLEVQPSAMLPTQAEQWAPGLMTLDVTAEPRVRALLDATHALCRDVEGSSFETWPVFIAVKKAALAFGPITSEKGDEDQA